MLLTMALLEEEEEVDSLYYELDPRDDSNYAAIVRDSESGSIVRRPNHIRPPLPVKGALPNLFIDDRGREKGSDRGHDRRIC